MKHIRSFVYADDVNILGENAIKKNTELCERVVGRMVW
jgi:hypothetical protein